MLTAVLPLLRCPECMTSPLRAVESGIQCRACATTFPLRGGILDMSGDERLEVITPFQRVMQTPLIVWIYEGVWRRLGYFLASSRPFGRELATVLRLCAGKDSGPILDLACGPGIFTRPLAHRCPGIVVGLDLSWPMLKRARRLLDRDGIKNVTLIHASAFRLPFVDGAFPLVTCCGALHLFDRPSSALDEIRRVSTTAGHLTVQTTIRPSRSAGIAFVLERFIRFGFFDESGLRAAIREHGFEITESERHRISFTFLSRHIS